MEKTKQEIMRSYVNSAIRFADFYNNYAKYFAKNPQKKLQGEKFYGKKIFEIFKQVDMLSETEKNFFYNSLVEMQKECQREEVNRLLTLQFSFAKYYKSKYEAIETVFRLKKLYKQKQNEKENTL